MRDEEIMYALLAIVLGIFIIPLIFMLIWNNIMPDLCGFNEITFWESFFLGIGLRLINGTLSIRRILNERK